MQRNKRVETGRDSIETVRREWELEMKYLSIDNEMNWIERNKERNCNETEIQWEKRI